MLAAKRAWCSASRYALLDMVKEDGFGGVCSRRNSFNLPEQLGTNVIYPSKADRSHLLTMSKHSKTGDHDSTGAGGRSTSKNATQYGNVRSRMGLEGTLSSGLRRRKC